MLLEVERWLDLHVYVFFLSPILLSRYRNLDAFTVDLIVAVVWSLPSFATHALPLR